MPISTFRHPQLLKPEDFNAISKDQFVANAPAKKERKRVSFKPSVSVRPIRHVNDIPEEELKEAWYNRREFDAMKKAFARTVKMISHGVYPGDDENHCARGLEYRVRVGALARRENKSNGLEAVLDEQDRQMHHGVVDDELIREAFVRENIQCRLSALQSGIRDQEEARFIHQEAEEYSNDDLGEDSMDMDYCEVYQSRQTSPIDSQAQRLHPSTAMQF